MYALIFLSFLALALASPAFAQDVSVDSSTNVTVESSASVTNDISVSSTSGATVDILIDQEIADENFTVAIEAETLPYERFLFTLENAFFQVRRVFTLNAEKKVQLDQLRLNALDRKLVVCTDLGDTACQERIEGMIAKAEERAQKHLEKKREVLANIETNYEEWRKRREILRSEILEKKEERDEDKEEFRAKFEERREEAKSELKTRQEKMDLRRAELRKEIIERRENVEFRLEERKQDREELIEQRSQILKERLDATRKRVEERRSEIENQIAAE